MTEARSAVLARKRRWAPVLRTASGTAHLLDRRGLEGLDVWHRAAADSRHDHRFFELVEDTIRQNFEYFYLLLEGPRGEPRGVQPLFIHSQNILGGIAGPLASAIACLERRAPRLLTVRTLMLGSPVGEGFLCAGGEDPRCYVRHLAEALLPAAERLGASLIALKEFPAAWRPALDALRDFGYSRIPSMPYVALDLGFRDFDEHLRTLSASVRKDLRRKFREAAAGPPITLEVTDDVSGRIDELYPLYLQVYERARLRFERITPEYFIRLGRDMPDRARFFIWSQAGRPIAWNACTLHGDALWAEYLGMDYRVALDLHLYFLVTRDEINWCCRNGVRCYYSTSLNYDPKFHLRFRLLPLDLYIRHVSGMVNLALRRVAPWLSPATHDKVLRKFPNAMELWR